MKSKKMPALAGFAGAIGGKEKKTSSLRSRFEYGSGWPGVSQPCETTYSALLSYAATAASGLRRASGGSSCRRGSRAPGAR